jgi:hypothetical protein
MARMLAGGDPPTPVRATYSSEEPARHPTGCVWNRGWPAGPLSEERCLAVAAIRVSRLSR